MRFLNLPIMCQFSEIIQNDILWYCISTDLLCRLTTATPLGGYWRINVACEWCFSVEGTELKQVCREQDLIALKMRNSIERERKFEFEIRNLTSSYHCLSILIEYGCMFVCMFVCLMLIPAWSSLVRYTCCTWEEAEFIGRGSYRKINSVPPTLLPLRTKTHATLISFYNFFQQFFSYLTSPLIKSLTRYILLYICNLW